MHRQDSTIGIYCSIINAIDVFLYAIGHYMYIDLLRSFSINSYRIFHHNYAYEHYAYVDGLYKKSRNQLLQNVFLLHKKCVDWIGQKFIYSREGYFNSHFPNCEVTVQNT